MKKRSFTPYPSELKDKLYALALSMPDTKIDEKLKVLFAENPEFEKHRKRLTGQRAYALIGDVRKKHKLADVERIEFEKLLKEDRSGKLCSDIVGVMQGFKTDGLRATAMRDRIAKRYPQVIFPPAQLLVRLIFHGEKAASKRTPVHKYALEGDGFRVEVTCFNPRKKKKIMEMIGTLLDD